ncbi:hypothetical protein GCM10023093_27490 [Nemorincola caseinilytica]|uniref:Uncharacterized protein n=1 Tax=Nemorincola caseinilytica TaxID=2054315 RepID=A0ABP8NPL7_9BACT
MTTTEKKKPDFFVFKQVDGKSQIVGSGFKHRNGKSINLYIGDLKCVIHPAKAQPVQEGESG